MPYVVVGILILALAVYAAVSVGYRAFAAMMSVVNTVSGEPVICLRGRVIAEAITAATTRRRAG